MKNKKKTTIQFIAESKLIWGNRYDYSQVEYLNSKNKVKIVCIKHQHPFMQTPFAHLIMKRQGCEICQEEAKSSKRSVKAQLYQEKMIAIANEKFKKKFNYSKIRYVNSTTPVKIVCPEHGNFEMLLDIHVNSKFGCKKCSLTQNSIRARIKRDDFLNKAKEKYGDQFNYSKMNYIKYDQSIVITCIKHNESITTTPFIHLLTKFGGCKKCLNEYMHHVKSHYTPQEFINKLEAIFGNKYDYTLTDYQSCRTKVSLRCKKHDRIFKLLPQTLLHGVGCPICETEEKQTMRMNIANALKYREEFRKRQLEKKEISKQVLVDKPSGIAYGVDEFLRLAKLIHGDDFDYKYIKEDFKNLNTDVRIICKKHNFIFSQKPVKHLKGQGCPRCIGRHRDTASFIKEVKEIYGDYYDYSNTVFKGTTTHVIVKCKYHDSFKITPIEHLRGKGCPNCYTSLMELSLYHYLLNNLDTDVIHQQQFSWLKTTRTMPLDLYIPEYNIAIECQGEQHFSPQKGFGGSAAYKHQCEKDKLKFNLCKDHGITLIYYSRTTYKVPKNYLGLVYTKPATILNAIKNIIND